jgi:hypothetical protein
MFRVGILVAALGLVIAPLQAMGADAHRRGGPGGGVPHTGGIGRSAQFVRRL